MTAPVEEAAERLLTCHRWWKRISDREPDYEFEPEEWINWYDHDRIPAGKALDAARANLADRLGQPVSDHPWHYVKLCQGLLAHRIRRDVQAEHDVDRHQADRDES